jgi:hypothetical protein
LEGGRRVAKSKGHHKVFLVSVPSFEGNLPLYFFAHAAPVKGISKINHGDDVSLAKPVQSLTG